LSLYEIRRSESFHAWFLSLIDVRELRVDYGPRYRVYYKRTHRTVYLLLCGGTKSTQAADIKRAIAMAADLKR
jgi:putative addiction module killer protein